jgi:hypothetical protein
VPPSTNRAVIPLCQSTARRIDDAHVGTNLHHTTRQFKPIDAIWPIRHVDVCEKQGDGRAIFQKGKCLSAFAAERVVYPRSAMIDSASVRTVGSSSAMSTAGGVFFFFLATPKLPARSTAGYEVWLLPKKQSEQLPIAVE